MKARVSIVIPTLDEAEALPATLSQLDALSPPPCEVIVADGGSTDETESVARTAGATFVRCRRRGRAAQMNEGARRAAGDVLAFVHADTWLWPNAAEVMARTLDDRRNACGGFVSLMAGPRGVRWLTSLHNFVKTWYAPLLFRPHLFFFRHARLLFGDQVIFCRREDFLEVGGYREEPVMEEATLCMALCRRGRVVQVPHVVVSSDRRVRAWGFWRSHARFMLIGTLWGLGVSGRRLRALYPDVRDQRTSAS